MFENKGFAPPCKVEQRWSKGGLTFSNANVEGQNVLDQRWSRVKWLKSLGLLHVGQRWSKVEHKVEQTGLQRM